MTDDVKTRWYLTALATVYLALCAVGSLHHLWVQVWQGGTIPVLNQMLCLGFAIAAGTYFLRPRVGHIALAALTGLTLIAIGTTDPGATAFHLCMLLVLLVPFYRKQNHNQPANNTVHTYS